MPRVSRDTAAAPVAEQRDFRMHEKLLLDVIMRQAGSIEKAILEGVMNSIEAGATRVDITVTPRTVEITDDGKGFRDRREIETFFEVFGQPHSESENKKWAQFRMGRGQLFAFGVNHWQTGPFLMDVDIKSRLGYDLRETSKPFKGCSVKVALYDPVGDRQIYAITREVTRYVKYVEVPVFVNGKNVTTPASTAKWGPESSEDAWIKLTETGSTLEIYNLGVLVCTVNRYVHGVGGVIVSRKRLDVNFARNDIIRSCAVWKRIAKRLDASDSAAKVKTKRSLTDEERLHLIAKLVGGEMTVFDARKSPIFVDCSGHPWSANSIQRAGWSCFTVAPRGSAKGDKLLQSRMALVLDEDLLAAFPCKPERVFKHPWTSSTYEWERSFNIDLPFKPFAKLEREIRDDAVIVPEQNWTRAERRWQSVATDMQRLIAGYEDRRQIMIGTSDCFEGWTDGSSYIAISRQFLAKLPFIKEDRPVIASLGHLANLLAHETCHDDNSATDVGHTPEFYRAFHDMQGAVHDAVDRTYRTLVNGALGRLDKRVEEAATKVERKAKPAA